MKKLLLLLAAVAVVFTGCENANIDDSQTPLIEVVGGEEALSLDFPSNGASTKTITFNSNYDWSVKTSDEWIKVSPESGKAGEECQVQVSLEENNTYDLRNGNVTLTIDKYSVEIAVTQQPKNGLTLSNSEVKLPQSGGAFDVTVLANVDFEYEIKAEWIKAVKTRALAENKVRFEAEANPTTDPRTGEIVFKGEGLTATLTVTQSQTNIITLSTSTVEMNGEDGTISVDVPAHIEYEVTIEEGCDWIQLVESRTATTSVLTFIVLENTSGDKRTAKITISGEEISETITINQKRNIPTLPTNEIWYTSTSGSAIEIRTYEEETFGASIVSNTYENGQGVIIFDGPVTSIGMPTFYNCTSLSSITIPNSVTSIGDAAFSGCSSLTSITIPDNVTSIGEEAFYKCTSLTSANLGNGVKLIGLGAFQHCMKLEQIVIPENVTSIGSLAFSGCSSLSSVTIPDSVTSIGKEAFYNCTGRLIVNCNIPSATSASQGAFYRSQFTEVVIGDNVTSIGSYAFSRCTSLTSITIPDSVTSIEDFAFSGCTSLTDTYVNITDLAAYAISNNTHLFPGSKHLLVGSTEITELVIPESVTSIGSLAFSGCSSLTSVTIDNSVTSIGNYAFNGCTSLTSVTIGNSVTSIGNYAFNGCTSLTSVTIGNSVTSIGSFAFEGCSSLKSVTIPNSVTEIENYVFNGCSSLTSITIPDSVTSIGDYTFGNCSSLTSITIPDSVTSIEEYVFYRCISLTSVTIPDSVTSIRSFAFEGCSSLISITIPDSVTLIREWAFYGCTSLTSVYCKPTTPPTGRPDMFNNNASGRKIYVPRNSVEAYKAASGWSEFASSIVGYDF